MTWLLIRMAALILARTIGNAFLLALSAAVACAAFFSPLDLGCVIFDRLTGVNLMSDLRGGGFLLALIAIGYIFAAPGLLLLYFPASMIIWRRQRPRSHFVFCAAAIATVYAFLLILAFRYRPHDIGRLWEPPDSLEWIGLISFNGVGLLTGLIHYQMLIMCRKWKAGERIRPLMFFKRLDSKIERL